jgi:hypothetical protein
MIGALCEELNIFYLATGVFDELCLPVSVCGVVDVVVDEFGVIYFTRPITSDGIALMEVDGGADLFSDQI